MAPRRPLAIRLFEKARWLKCSVCSRVVDYKDPNPSCCLDLDIDLETKTIRSATCSDCLPADARCGKCQV